MFEGILEKLLNTYLGKYVEGLDKEHLSIGVWKGDINLQNVKIRSDALDSFKLPFKVIYGEIGTLQVKVPWRSLSSQPVIVVLESLYVIVTPQVKKDWQIIDFNNSQDKLLKLVSFGDSVENKIKNEGSDNEGYFSKLTTKIMDNIQITVKFEDTIFSNKPYSFGFTLKELSAQTCNQDWQYEFFDRTNTENKDMPVYKLLSIEKFAFYWQSKEESLASLECLNKEDMHDFMEILFPIGSTHIENYNYIIEPRKLKQISKLKDKKDAKFDINIEVDNFSVKLHKDQYDNICRLAEEVGDYGKFQMLYNSTKRFKFLRPVRSIQSIKRENVLTSGDFINENAVMWWKYAIKTVMKLNREKKGSIYEFRIAKSKLQQYEANFIDLFQKYLRNEDYDTDELHHIIVSVDKSYLEKWVTVITKIRIDSEEKKKNEGGWFGFLGAGAQAQDTGNEIISSKEIEEMYTTLKEQFLSSTEKEEVKEASEVKNVKLSLIVKKGGLNLVHKNVNVDLYFHDIGFCLKQYGNGKMIMDAQTRDFGLKMDSEQHYEIIEKMDESEVFWEMTYLKNPPGNEIEHSLDLTINPIKLIYEGSFIKTLVVFFKNETELQIKEQAAEKWADFKEGAGTQLQQSIKTGRKDIKIWIYSPILLIPLIKNNPESKMWAVNLGNFTLKSDRSEELYEYYKFGVNAVMIKFYRNYNTWEKLAKEEVKRKKLLKGDDGSPPEDFISKDPENFTLLEEFEIESQLWVNTSVKAPEGRGEVEVIAKASPVKFNLNDETYNHLVTIHRSFTYEDPEEIVSRMIEEKEKIIKNAKLISAVKLRGSNIKIFAKRYAVISKNYLYFYREIRDLTDEQSMFLKDAMIIDVSDTVGEKHALELRSKFGSAVISFNNKKTKDEWRYQIHKIVIELNNNADNQEEIALKEIEQEQKEANAKLFYLVAECPELKATWIENDGTVWLTANLNNLKLKVNKPVVGLGVYLGVGSGQVYSHSTIKNPDSSPFMIATSQKPEQSSNNFVEVEIELNEKPENPSGDEICLNVRIGYLNLNYYPPIIQSLIHKLRRIRYQYEYDEEEIKLKHKDRLKLIESQILKEVTSSEEIVKVANDFIQKLHGEGSSVSWKKFSYPYIIVRVALSEVEGDFLHHIYATPIAKLKIGETRIDYDMYVDHDDLNGTLGGIRVFEMTNYPYTLDPRKPEDFKTKSEQFEIFGLKDAQEKNTLSFECRFFTPTCPNKPNKRKNKVKIYVSSIKYIFQLDYLMRIKDFFFDQFLDSLVDTNPYQDIVKSNIEEKLVKFYDEAQVNAYDLEQEDEITEILVEAKNPWIILRARNHYKEEFTIFLGNIHVTSEIITERGKWNLDLDKEVRVGLFKISIEETTLYHRDGKVGSCELLTVDFKQLLFSEKLEYIDPLALNKAMQIDLNFSPIQWQISKKQFTYLMKCLDLNINYDDGMRSLYDFKRKKEFTEINPIKEDYKNMVVRIRMTCISLSCYFLGEFLAEIVCQNFTADIDRFVSTKNIIDLAASSFWAFGEESIETGHKQVIIGPRGSSNSVFTEKSFYDFDTIQNSELKKVKSNITRMKCMNTKIVMKNGEKEIMTELDQLKLFFKMHVFMLLFHFFTEGLPKYDIDDADLPNLCK